MSIREKANELLYEVIEAERIASGKKYAKLHSLRHALEVFLEVPKDPIFVNMPAPKSNKWMTPFKD